MDSIDPVSRPLAYQHSDSASALAIDTSDHDLDPDPDYHASLVTPPTSRSQTIITHPTLHNDIHLSLASITGGNFHQSPPTARYIPDSSHHTPARPALRSVSLPLHSSPSSSASSIPRAPQKSFKELINRFNSNVNSAGPLVPTQISDRPKPDSLPLSTPRVATRLPKPRSPVKSTPIRQSGRPTVSPLSARTASSATAITASPTSRSARKHTRATLSPADVERASQIVRGIRRGSEGSAHRQSRKVAHRRSLSDAELIKPDKHGDPLQPLPRFVNAASISLSPASTFSATRTNRQRPVGKENYPSKLPVSPPTAYSKRFAATMKTQDVPAEPIRAYINAPAHPTSPSLRSSRPRRPVPSAISTGNITSMATRQIDRGYSPRFSRRRIPELSNVDFAERRARIERAISQTIDEQDVKDMRRLHKRKSSGDSRVSAASSGRYSSACESVDGPDMPRARPNTATNDLTELSTPQPNADHAVEDDPQSRHHADSQPSGRALLTDMLQSRDRRDSSSTDLTRDSILSYTDRSVDDQSINEPVCRRYSQYGLDDPPNHNPTRNLEGAIADATSSHQDEDYASAQTPRSKPQNHVSTTTDLDQTPRPFVVSKRTARQPPLSETDNQISGAIRGSTHGYAVDQTRHGHVSQDPPHANRSPIQRQTPERKPVPNRADAALPPLPSAKPLPRAPDELAQKQLSEQIIPADAGFGALDFGDVLSVSGLSSMSKGQDSDDGQSQFPTSHQDSSAAPSYSSSQDQRRFSTFPSTSSAISMREITEFAGLDGQGLGLNIDVGTAEQRSNSSLPLVPVDSEQSSILSDSRTPRSRSSAEQMKAVFRQSCPSPRPTSHDPSHHRRVITRARSAAAPSTGDPSQLYQNGLEPQESGPLASLDPRASLVVQEPTPEQRKLLKRRNIIKELLDTEYSHHQDMKIVIDIYKATVGDLITAEDKQALFGNIHKVEAFSLEFYDALKPAVAPFYVPQRSSRWHAKRASVATSTVGSTADSIDEDKDRQTSVGRVFMTLLPKMEEVYGTYLRNHDLANQRLAKLQNDPTVHCWLTECHKNASDITTAWDLDSLLVKPVQRILKYPLLLQQLLEATVADHPDRPELTGAVQESLNISQRINEAKKRADLVEQIVTRKRKDNDMKAGLAKAFGRRGDRVKERVGVAEAYQDPVFDELAHKFGGHFIRLQVCMRDVQGSLTETDKAVERFNAFAASLETYVEVSTSAYPMVLNKWRKYALAVRELAAVALPDHKAQIKKRVIEPMLTAVKLHEGPQNAIAKRKQALVDYAKCKHMESKGEKADKKTLEESQLYEALNEQLKIDLPRLYKLTARLIQACLACHLDIQKEWMWTWENKLRPVIDRFPSSIAEIEPAFVRQFETSLASLSNLQMCNGSLLTDVAEYLSPSASMMNDSIYSRAPSISGRTMSVGSEMSHTGMTPDKSRSARASLSMSPMLPPEGASGMTMGPRAVSNGPQRSNSSVSYRAPGAPINGTYPTRMPSNTSKSSYPNYRGPPSGRPSDTIPPSPINDKRHSAELSEPSARPASGTYFVAQSNYQNNRYSDVYSTSSTPMTDSLSPYPVHSGISTPRSAIDGQPVQFVAASLFEFNIDRARKESGYPYLTYVQGEVFDVLAQKGELWLARNQEDSTGSLGWIWEQHFVILSQEV